jgi:DNA-binding MarR family transcriptional regulator
MPPRRSAPENSPTHTALTTRRPTKKTPARSRSVSWNDLGSIAQTLTLASWTFRTAIRNVTAEYRLLPKGAWILALIDNSQVMHPSDVTNFFNVGASVITDELARLTEARLITYGRDKNDRRWIELALTQRGVNVSSRIRKELSKFISERFKSYSRDEVLQFTRMLYDFAYADGMSPQSVEGPPANRRRAAKGPSRRR